MPLQNNWRWCRKCMGMFYGGGSGSRCPTGGTHDSEGSGNYSLMNNNPGDPGQKNWRWCHQCQGLFFASGNLGKCPATNGPHSTRNSGNYSLSHQGAAAGQQNNWRWCSKCLGMYYSGGISIGGFLRGVCPMGGEHGESWNYRIINNP